MKEGAPMTQTTMVVAIERPVADVFAFVADAETAPRWQDDIMAVRRTTPGPTGVGTAYQALRMHLHERVASVLLTTAYEPQQTVAFESAVGDSHFKDSYSFAALGNSTRVTLLFEHGTLTRGVRHVFSRELAALAKLKAVLEAPDGLGTRATIVARPASLTPR